MAVIQTVDSSQYSLKPNAIGNVSLNGSFVPCNSIGSLALFARYTAPARAGIKYINNPA